MCVMSRRVVENGLKRAFYYFGLPLDFWHRCTLVSPVLHCGSPRRLVFLIPFHFFVPIPILLVQLDIDYISMFVSDYPAMALWYAWAWACTGIGSGRSRLW